MFFVNECCLLLVSNIHYMDVLVYSAHFRCMGGCCTYRFRLLRRGWMVRKVPFELSITRTAS